ncbi:uncharacterized protein ASPGLDRAFT_49602 [Aspergillus glaucus CBS 516.65]|uniref:Uncharacterized protein n=1 Tax=Aspergillus glaucus CBS 516.65 TaxID=1160497 RepID=A0A1L9VE60_ASPGL|nr:hypothetical protein ASPGLDRAFT_49602 [Aspergillus glaucus CBS 516.65]OJJ82186.1 hypothetical protein ASPGLDRAFT_49602 [Aspergillus glaucus CBS 516.65]
MPYKLTIRYANEVFFYHYLEDIQTIVLDTFVAMDVSVTLPLKSDPRVPFVQYTILHAAKGRLGELRNVDLGEGIFTDVQRIDKVAD